MISTVGFKRNCTLINYRYFYFEIVSVPVPEIEEKKYSEKKCEILLNLFGHTSRL